VQLDWFPHGRPIADSINNCVFGCLQVDRIALISREGFDSPFEIRYSIPLGQRGGAEGVPGGAVTPSLAPVNVPYVATVGSR
jgi:hypothetical protein